MDLNYYKKINNAYGVNDIRDAYNYELKQKVFLDFYSTLDAYKVTIKDVPIDLTIVKTVNENIKKIKSMPGQTFQYGDVVDWHDSHWLVTEKDTNDDIVTHGKMTECNYLLRWQNENREVVERWVVTQDASSYSNGIEGEKTIQFGSDQILLFIPLDDETVKLRREKRFFIDNNTVNPTPYELTRVDTTTSVKNGHGYLNCIVTESQLNLDSDRIDLMLCDYLEPIDDPEVDKKGKCEICCKYDTIKSGGSTRKYTAKFYDINGSEVTTVTPIWNVVCDFSESLSVVYGDTLNISMNDDSKIGMSFTIKLSGIGYTETEKTIYVVSIY